MQINNEEKIIQLMTEMRDIIRKHDRGVRPMMFVLFVLLVVLIFVTYFR